MIEILRIHLADFSTALQENYPREFLSGQLSEVEVRVNELAAKAGVYLVTITVVTGNDLSRLLGSYGGDDMAVVTFPRSMPLDEAAKVQQMIFSILATDGKLYTLASAEPNAYEMRAMLITIEEYSDLCDNRTCALALGYEAEFRKMSQDLIPQAISAIDSSILNAMVHGMRAVSLDKTGIYIMVNGEHEMIMRGELDPGDVSLHYKEYFPG